MLDFKPVTIEDKEVIQHFFNKADFRNCDFSFSNIFCWQNSYNTSFVVEDGILFFLFKADGRWGYLFPLGDGDLKHAVERLNRDAGLRKIPLRIFAVTQKMYDLIEAQMPGEFVYKKDRSWSEYIYSSKDLIALTGKKYQPKRNHINKFMRSYAWEYLPITREIIPDCLNLYRRWCAENGGCNNQQSLVEEHIATHRAFEHFEQLGLIGGALRINGEILAYSYGQPLTKDTFGIHAEKSLYEIDGGFVMMNRQFAERNCADYPYINREEDLGLESLRKAKLSYHPAILLEKGYLYRKNEPQAPSDL
ncbi:MAG: phosphatidylglycerol lysyltransferase domain-containing protein [Dysgonamonadaceae bacterium]|jgi:hypothetical protein|nr:phosphatidylglycerol lysyltransferase domain-containing protein [Dysgonamonadaceae bacterium]